MKIEKVSILISNFEQTVRFYRDTLQLNLLSFDDQQALFLIGESILELKKDFDENSYYYHFAFNIHSNLFSEAKAWLKKRVPLLKEDNLEEIYFDGKTQGYACYFEDPSGNIVEFIAREVTSPQTKHNEFTTDNILSISEISFTTSKIKEASEELNGLGISIRDNDHLNEKGLNFLGDYDDGAFILLGPIGRRWLFSTKGAIPSPVSIQTNKGKICNFNYLF